MAVWQTKPLMKKKVKERKKRGKKRIKKALGSFLCVWPLHSDAYIKKMAEVNASKDQLWW